MREELKEIRRLEAAVVAARGAHLAAAMAFEARENKKLIGNCYRRKDLFRYFYPPVSWIYFKVIGLNKRGGLRMLSFAQGDNDEFMSIDINRNFPRDSLVINPKRFQKIKPDEFDRKWRELLAAITQLPKRE